MKTSVSDRQARFSQFCDFCDEHPAMASRFEEITDLMGQAGDAVGAVDEAEARIIEMSRGFNAQMLSDWRRLALRLCRAMRAADAAGWHSHQRPAGFAGGSVRLCRTVFYSSLREAWQLRPSQPLFTVRRAFQNFLQKSRKAVYLPLTAIWHSFDYVCTAMAVSIRSAACGLCRLDL